MKIKKIQFKFKSGFATQLESDTLLSYIFANDFDNLKDIFGKFKSGENLPFVISSAFFSSKLPKPYFFNSNNNEESEEKSLDQMIKSELDRKKKKSLNTLPIQKDIFETIFEGSMQDYENKISQILKEEKNNQEKTIFETLAESKNKIPRDFSNKTEPYSLEINYYNGSFDIFVKVYDDEAFAKFYKSMEKTFLALGWGKYKSKGYGKIEYINCLDLSTQEQEVFDYFEKLQKEKNIYFVLNNFKLTKEDIEKIDFEQSNLNIQSKNTKSLRQNPFKGNMSFVYPGSVIVSKDGLKGGYYQVNNSFNFGYLL
ncbi:hypothetical protein [Candidatus Absconditicoccus praedator]|uniref:hypothetical protein n=1 Tax=Candidatus Absconditicoccus praedator TaxID=2735562 RepID=UPI001E2A53F6|nr:hypothetical protein [Candidatus Absconditicoccus praedator]UFX83257.1 hypothetical protein HLG78_03960 [Candidatus Absconditicoccus praedator]